VTSTEKYVAAAYLVVFVMILLYVVIIAAKLSRLDREVGELADDVRARRRGEAAGDAAGGAEDDG
jgi:CcmD family protein